MNLRLLVPLFTAMAVHAWLPLGLADERPNVLVCISDDQSYPHASAYGHPVIQTPGFDAVARQGVLFDNAFTPAPGCSPMRAAFLTGRPIWQIEAAGTHASHFPKHLQVFPQELETHGYHVGFTGKPWGPGNYQASGWERNPAGPAYNKRKLKSPTGISSTDYAANFKDFLQSRPAGAPFCFWFGGHEPHRSFGLGLGQQAGMDPAQVEVPSFLPDQPVVRSDLLDYFFEIQWFDQHLVRMLAELEQQNMLENTVVIVTSDNGMSFPRAKANLYEFGIHMPLAISWPAGFVSGQRTDALVSLLDVTATIYDLCQVPAPAALEGLSLLDVLKGNPQHARNAVFAGRERHSSSRWNSLGYPCRCVRTERFLYIRNYAPERWPAGAPMKYTRARYDSEGELVSADMGPEHGGYHDIDACPTLDFMIAERDDPNVGRHLEAAIGKRPPDELFDILQDPGCLQNLAQVPAFRAELERHRELLVSHLKATGDLRELDPPAAQVWETYPRYSPLRWFPEPDWASGEPALVPDQPWLDARRPH